MTSANGLNFPDETLKALRISAPGNGCGLEAEGRASVDAAVSPKEKVGVGSMLAAIGRDVGGVDLNIARAIKSADQE